MESKSSWMQRTKVREEYSDVVAENDAANNKFSSLNSGAPGQGPRNQYFNMSNAKKMIYSQNRRKKLNRTGTPGSMGLLNQQTGRR